MSLRWAIEERVERCLSGRSQLIGIAADLVEEAWSAREFWTPHRLSRSCFVPAGPSMWCFETSHWAKILGSTSTLTVSTFVKDSYG